MSKGRRKKTSDEPLELDVEAAGDFEQTVREALAAIEEVEPGPAGAGQEDEAVREAGAPNGAARIAALEAENAGLRERMLRALADLDNFRKRSDREQREVRRYAGIDLLQELLPILDNLERAATASGSLEDVRQGIAMILRQLEEAFRRLGIERIDAQGQVFDPMLHEAVSRHEDPTVDEPVVSEQLQPGYRLHDRLVRPAVVKVAMPPEPAAPADDPESS